MLRFEGGAGAEAVRSTMRVPGLKTARLAARWLRGRLGGGVPILGYHRIADVSDDPYQLCVSRRNFAEQVDVLRRETKSVALQDLVRALAAGEVPRRAVVVTFDDGYADNLHNALPELERHEVPATVFVATGLLGGRFWWDELARAVPASPDGLGRLASVLERAAGAGEPVRLDLSRPRREVLGDLVQLLQRLSVGKRRTVLRLLNESMPQADNAATGRALTEEELRRLADSRLVDVGSHTVSHAALAELPADRQHAEIREGKRALEEILDRGVTSFAYPHGSIGPATPGLVRRAGFSCACGSVNDLASTRSDPYRLPRFWIGNWDGAELSRWLKRWVEA